jgi:hypothetical protein
MASTPQIKIKNMEPVAKFDNEKKQMVYVVAVEFTVDGLGPFTIDVTREDVLNNLMADKVLDYANKFIDVLKRFPKA